MTTPGVASGKICQAAISSQLEMMVPTHVRGCPQIYCLPQYE